MNSSAMVVRADERAPASTSPTFPRISVPEVSREHLLATIEQYFEAGTQLLVIDGEPGAGKTVLAAQFAARAGAFGLFVNTSSRWCYDPDFLCHDLCTQIYGFLGVSSGPDTGPYTLTTLSLLFHRLGRTPHPVRKHHCFVLDGLHSLSDADVYLRQRLLDLMPIGLAGFKVLLTDSADGTLVANRNVAHKSWRLTGFSYDESKQFLADLSLSDTDIRAINKLCRTRPGHIASVRRLLHTGVTVADVTSKAPALLADLFELEWKQARIADPETQRILAFIAFDRNDRSITSIAALLRISEDTVRAILASAPFIEYDPIGCRYSYFSPAFRDFAQRKLASFRRDTESAIIEELLLSPDSAEALATLPLYLRDAGRLADLITYLSPDRIGQTLVQSQSLGRLRETTGYGLRASRELERDGDLLRFALQRATLTDVDGAAVWRSEVDALVALGDYPAALALAQSTTLKEERLHLLAALGKGQRLNGLTPELTVQEEIKSLLAAVSDSLTAAKGREIASDLFYVDIDLALTLVERTAEAGVEGVKHDWLLASFVAETVSGAGGKSPHAPDLRVVRDRLSDPDAKQFSTGVEALRRAVSATDILADVRHISQPRHQILILIDWCARNPRRYDALDVIDACLSCMIATTEYVPSARDLLHLAVPLRFATDHKRVQSLIIRLDSQLGVAQTKGPTAEYLRLQLALAAALFKIDRDIARHRIASVYLDTSTLADLSIRLECLARLLRTLAIVDSELYLESTEGLHTLAQSDFERVAAELFATTAEHFDLAKGALLALSPVRLDLASKIIDQMNTRFRRDLARQAVVITSARTAETDGQWHTLFVQLDAIVRVDEREGHLVAIVGILRDSDRVHKLSKGVLHALFDRILGLQRKLYRTMAVADAIVIIKRSTGASLTDQLPRMTDALEAAWRDLSAAWERIDSAFSIACALAPHDALLARTYVDRGRAAKAETLGGAPAAGWIFTAPLRLAIAAYGGLLAQREDTSADRQELHDLIRRVPSAAERASAAADLALRVWLAGRHGECAEIVKDWLRPELRFLQGSDKGAYEEVVASVAPALYVSHASTALIDIAALDVPLRDIALSQIVDLYCRRASPVEPYEARDSGGFEIGYEACIDILGLAMSMTEDATVFRALRAVADSCHGRRSDSFTAQQRAELAKRIEDIAGTAFPQASSIQHRGYVIVTKALLLAMRRGGSEQWQELLKDARGIPNLADRAYVLTFMSEYVPAKLSLKSALIDEAVAVVDSIAAVYERVNRFATIGGDAWEVSKDKGREVIRKAMRLSSECGSVDVQSLQQQMIDLVHRVDPEFASTLCNEMDDDPARQRARAESAKERLKARVEVLKARKALTEGGEVDRFIKEKRQSLPNLAWSNLAALNAGRIAAKRFDEVRPFLEAAAEMPLSDGYPIVLWVIANASRKYTSSPDAKRVLRPIYEATTLVCRIASSMSLRGVPALPSVEATMPSSMPISAGERDLALKIIGEWIENEAVEFVQICDPYFGLEQLDIVKLILDRKPQLKIRVLTSRKCLRDQGIVEPLGEAFRSHWQSHVSDQDPPWTEIVIVGVDGSDQLPVHDRWMLSKTCGLRIGTSLGSLGAKRDSEISRMSAEDVQGVAPGVMRLLDKLEPHKDGRRLRYDAFLL